MAPAAESTAKMMNRVDYLAPEARTTPAVILPSIYVDMKKAQKYELKIP